jgi:hypothetical protein
MTKQNDRVRLRAGAALAVLMVMVVLTPLGLPGTFARTNGIAPPPPAASVSADCEGDACPSVTLTFDDAKQQYRARNNSTDRWVSVSASNLAAASNACLAPGKDAFLPLKSLVAPYRAVFAEARCGEPEGVGQGRVTRTGAS